MKTKLLLFNDAYSKIRALNKSENNVFDTLMKKMGYPKIEWHKFDNECEEIWDMLFNPESKTESVKRFKKLLDL
jgi:hypothetical protein|tara:strand:+ start:727 stop:948 length:222 start_codon:yes stop_codon:yes gene_type:complete